jgi:surface antigen
MFSRIWNVFAMKLYSLRLHFKAQSFWSGTALVLLCLGLQGCLSTTPKALPVTNTLPDAGEVLPDADTLLAPLKGGLVGRLPEKSLTKAEMQRGLAAEYQALETEFGRSPVPWADEKTGNSGTVVAGTPYRVGQQDCRPYRHVVVIKSVETTFNGAACRQANGAWLLLE